MDRNPFFVLTVFRSFPFDRGRRGSETSVEEPRRLQNDGTNQWLVLNPKLFTIA